MAPLVISPPHLYPESNLRVPKWIECPSNLPYLPWHLRKETTPNKQLGQGRLGNFVGVLEWCDRLYNRAWSYYWSVCGFSFWSRKPLYIRLKCVNGKVHCSFF